MIKIERRMRQIFLCEMKLSRLYVLEWGNKSARHHVGDLIGPRTESAVCALNQRHSGHISNLNLPFFSLRQRARRLRGLNLYQSAAPR